MPYGKILTDKLKNSDGEYLSIGPGVRVFETITGLEGSATLLDGDIVVVRERGNAEYKIQPSTYTALEGDIILTSGQVAELVISDSLTLASFGAYLDGVTDDSDAVDASVSRLGTATVPSGYYIKYDLDPDYDTTVFLGEGKINTTDPWGYDHVFDIALANSGSEDTAKSRINRKIFMDEAVSIGFLGDSITDGRNSTDWSTNPVNSDGNLRSTDYDHNSNGGKNSWPAVAGSAISATYPESTTINIYNISKNGMALVDGWGYRNFDYGFFQNAAYGNDAPDVLVVALGFNDGTTLSDVEAYKQEWRKIVNKAAGYGCAVCVANVNINFSVSLFRTDAFIEVLSSEFETVDYFAVGEHMRQASRYTPRLNTLIYEKTPGGGEYDFVHPTDYGMRVMGGAFAKQILGDYVLDTSVSDSNYLNVLTSAHGIENGSYRGPGIETVSGLPYLDDLGSLSYFDLGDDYGVVKFSVWINDPSKNMMIVLPKEIEFTDETSSGVSLRVFNARYEDSSDDDFERDYTLLPTGVNLDGDYKAFVIEGLYYGLNIVQFDVVGGASKFYAPMVSFSSNPIEYAKMGELRKEVADGGSYQLGSSWDFGEAAFERSIYFPDCINGSTASSGGITVKDLDGAKLLILAKPEANKYLSFAIESDNLVIRDYSDTVLKTITGDFTGSFDIHWNPFLSGETYIHTVDSAGATKTTTSPISGGYTGGGVYLMNDSGAKATVRLSGLTMVR